MWLEWRLKILRHPKFTSEEMENLNRPVTIEVSKCSSTHKKSRLMWLHTIFSPIVKCQMIYLLPEIFCSIKKEIFFLFI